MSTATVSKPETDNDREDKIVSGVTATDQPKRRSRKTTTTKKTEPKSTVSTETVEKPKPDDLTKGRGVIDRMFGETGQREAQ